MRHPSPPHPDGEVSLVVTLGGLRVTVTGPVAEATALLAHLQAFRPSASSALPHGEAALQSPVPEPQARSEVPQSSFVQPASQRVEPESPRLHLRASRVEPESPRLQSLSVATPQRPVPIQSPALQVPLQASATGSPARLQVEASFGTPSHPYQTPASSQVAASQVPLQAAATGSPTRSQVEVSASAPSARYQAPPSFQSPAVQVPLQASATASPSRSQVEAAFPACPGDLLQRASALSGAANLSARDRIERAWRAGLWAREVLQGNFATPSSSVRLSLASRVYIVLGGAGTSPGVYRAFRDLTRDLGPIARSSAVFHGFPSDTEGEAYCRAAGVPWPPERQ